MHFKDSYEGIIAEPACEFEHAGELLDALAQRFCMCFALQAGELQDGVIEDGHLEVVEIVHGILLVCLRAHGERGGPGLTSIERSRVKGDSQSH